jgi:hypothetical protein
MPMLAVAAHRLNDGIATDVRLKPDTTTDVRLKPDTTTDVRLKPDATYSRVAWNSFCRI